MLRNLPAKLVSRRSVEVGGHAALALWIEDQAGQMGEVRLMAIDGGIVEANAFFLGTLPADDPRRATAQRFFDSIEIE
jgi:hypothetical protein